MTPPARRRVLARHAARTGLAHDPAGLEAAAITVCTAGEAGARDLLAMLGLIHPDGPGRTAVPAQPRSKPRRYVRISAGRST